ncbi:MAG: hypothetical protein IVW54_18895 [Candidatus Binataceae bacterium]|nr:hypothetical protein [Candidatus Binataceae bacterium]
MFAFLIVWLASIAASIAIGLRTPNWLIWRLFLFVPLFGDIIISGGYGNSGSPITIRMLTEPYTWFWFGVFLVYGVILFGPSAVVLGGLGWKLIEAKPIAASLPKSIIMASGVLFGSIVGGCYRVLYEVAVYQRLPLLMAVHNQAWLVASIVGGAAGGFIVGFFAATKSHSDGGSEAPVGGISRAPL